MKKRYDVFYGEEPRRSFAEFTTLKQAEHFAKICQKRGDKKIFIDCYEIDYLGDANFVDYKKVN
jgi:hypothetical protein